MTKYGSPEDLNRMMARMEAELSRPDPDDGAIIDFAPGEAPLVQVGDIRGIAVAYTRHYGLVEIQERSTSRFEWFYLLTSIGSLVLLLLSASPMALSSFMRCFTVSITFSGYRAHPGPPGHRDDSPAGIHRRGH